MTWLLALLLGAVIGITLGGLGGGGSVLAVPMLVYLLGQTPQEATSASLFIVGLTAVTSTAQHARSGNVRWKLGFAFAAAGVVASFAGTALNTRVDGTVLLVAFAGIMLVAATAMLARSRPRRAPATAEPAVDQHVVLTGVTGAAATGTTPTDTAPTDSAPAGTAQAATSVGAAATGGRTGTAAPAAAPGGAGPGGSFTRILLTGSVVGFLTGFLGVGGGFVIVPALVTVLGLSMPIAVGTSLLIIVLNALVALGARLGTSSPLDWSVVIPFTAAAIAASFAGKRISDRLPAQRLTQAFAVLVLIVAVLVLVEAL